MELTHKDIVEIPITKEDRILVRSNAKKAEIGGHSQIRSASERRDNLSKDQVCGQLGELAGNKHFFTVEDYKNNRHRRNTNPTIGDDGCDSPGYKIDFKASHAKKSNLLNYNLLVRPRERHKGCTYVLVLVKFKPTTRVFLIGWATDDMLEGRLETHGIFKNSFKISARELNRISDLKIELLETVQVF